jgi:transcriptional regulator with XRE-family HTH domain
MNPEKIGEFIKKLRLDNNLTQKDLADKYGVTYQAVSKWENGKNIPDIALLKEMSKDFNISIEDLLEGKKTNSKSFNYKWLFLVIAILVVIILSIIIIHNKDHNIKFKTITSSCEQFKLSGSILYNSSKSYIYISNINYCGGDDLEEYQSISCSLYEKVNNSNIKIKDCEDTKNNILLENYLKDLKITIDNYEQSCKNYKEDSLYLEIKATDKNNKLIVYNIPLKIEDNC